MHVAYEMALKTPHFEGARGAGGRTRVNKDGKAFSCLRTASGWCREITVVKKN